MSNLNDQYSTTAKRIVCTQQYMMSHNWFYVKLKWSIFHNC